MVRSPYTSGAIATLRKQLTKLDGFMSAQNSSPNVEDVGDCPVDVIPDASDLADSDMDCDNGYVAGTYCTMKTHDGTAKVFDAPTDVLASERVIEAEKGSYIENIEAWR